MDDPRAPDLLEQRLPALLHVVLTSDIRELQLQEGDMYLRLRRREGVPAAHEVGEDLLALPEAAPAEPRIQAITSPLVGTFYRAGKPGAPPLVDEGTWVEEDTVVGIVEALHVLTEVEAQCRGRIASVKATDGMPVQYGQPLFEVAPGD